MYWGTTVSVATCSPCVERKGGGALSPRSPWMGPLECGPISVAHVWGVLGASLLICHFWKPTLRHTEFRDRLQKMDTDSGSNEVLEHKLVLALDDATLALQLPKIRTADITRMQKHLATLTTNNIPIPTEHRWAITTRMLAPLLKEGEPQRMLEWCRRVWPWNHAYFEEPAKLRLLQDRGGGFARVEGGIQTAVARGGVQQRNDAIYCSS